MWNTGRTIQTNTHVAGSVLDCCVEARDRVAMLQIDLEKTFDRVKHDVLFCVLADVAVGHVIFEGVKMSYNNCYTRIIINRGLSDSIPVQSFVRHGSPLSPLLFSVYLERFCLSVAHFDSIREFKLHSAEGKLLAYADDVAVFCTNSESVAKDVSLTKSFCEAEGAA